MLILKQALQELLLKTIFFFGSKQTSKSPHLPQKKTLFNPSGALTIFGLLCFVSNFSICLKCKKNLD